jgi:hypothetical protein
MSVDELSQLGKSYRNRDSECLIMKNILTAGTVAFLLFAAADAACAIPLKDADEASGIDSAGAVPAAPAPLLEGRSAYEMPANPYGGLGGNDLVRPGANFGAPANAKDFSGIEFIIRR